MPQPYFNDVVMTSSYVPIVAVTDQDSVSDFGDVGDAGLKFCGYVRAKVGNTAAISMKSLAYPDVIGTLEANDPPIHLNGVDLSQIHVKSTHAGDVLKLAGTVDQL